MSYTMMKVRGLMAAPHTPLDSKGALNVDVVEDQVRWLVENGVKGAFVCGTTGEGPSLTADERMAVAKRWGEVCPPDFKLFVHVGHSSIEASKALARHARSIGADAIGAVGPYFFTPRDEDDLAGFCAEVSGAVPRMPFYYYHMPEMSCADVRVFDFLHVAADSIPALAGVKFTNEDLMDYARCVDFQDGRFDILFGRDEILLAGLSMGASGAVGSTYNFAACLSVQLMEAFTAGQMEEARRWQKRSQKLIAILGRYGGLAAGKAVMQILGIDCGPVRPPLRSLSGEERQELKRELDTAGYLESLGAATF